MGNWEKLERKTRHIQWHIISSLGDGANVKRFAQALKICMQSPD